MSDQFLVEGLDTTGLECVTKADLMQMVRNAYPYNGYGWLINSQTAPDVVATPILENFIWVELDGNNDKTGNMYRYNNGAWELIQLIDGSKMADNSLPISKILRGGNALDIIQANAANNALLWVAVTDAIQNNSLIPSKLVAPDGVNNYVLTCLAGVKAFTLFSTLATLFNNNTIPIAKLVQGAANLFLRMKSDGTVPEWTTAQIADLLAPGFAAGQVPKRNAGNTGWEPYTPAAGSVPQYLAASATLQSGAIAWDTKTLGGIPTGSTAAILQIEMTSSVVGGDNGWVKVEGRKESSGLAVTLGYCESQAGDIIKVTNQAILPVTTDKKLDLQITAGGANAGSADVKLIGYYA